MAEPTSTFYWEEVLIIREAGEDGFVNVQRTLSEAELIEQKRLTGIP